MPAITTIINTPLLFLRVFLNVATVAAGVGVVAAGVSVGVVVAKLVMNPPPDSPGINSNPLVQTIIILESSSSSLAFNRLIQAYEYDGYYNATATLLNLVEELNNYLEQAFPNTFFKAVVSNFSTQPEVNPSSRQKRLDYYISRTRRRRTFTIVSRSNRNSSTTSTSSPLEISYSSSPEETTQTDPQDPTSWTDSPDLLMSTNFGGSDSSPESTTASTSPATPDLESTVSGTTVQHSNCTTSTFNGASNTSVIYIIGTLYFKTTSNNPIDPNAIIFSLQSFNPIITLADKCLNPSPAPSAFNPTLSTVKPPSVVPGGTTSLANSPTIPLTLLSQTNSIVSPVQAAEASLTTPIPTTTTTASSIEPTTAANLG